MTRRRRQQQHRQVFEQGRSEREQGLLLLVEHVPDDGPPRQHDVRHERLHGNTLYAF